MSTQKKIEQLAKILQTHPDSKERARAVLELGAMRNGPAYEALGIAMLDSSPDVRKAVVQSFEEVGADWVLAPVLIRLRSNDPGARMVACRELGRLGDTEAVLPLINRLNDANFQVRVAAAYALGQLGDTRAIEPLQQLMRRALNMSMRQAIQRSLSLLMQKK
ncbi:MAG: HEAT repeat domain-containing protein [Candidatus Thorarchaeota archaeon]